MPKYPHTCRKKTSGNKYLYYPTVYYHGKQYQPGPGFRSRKEAYERALEIMQELRHGKYIENKVTVKELVIQYLNEAKHALEITTWNIEEGLFRNYIVPELGHIPLRELNSYHIQTLRDKIIDKISPGQSRATLIKLRKLLRYGIKWDLVKDNAAGKVELPKRIKSEKEMLSLDQFFYLLTQEEIPLKDRCAIALAGCAGLRRGEIFGLRWQDIDFNNKQVYIAKSFTGSIIKDAKTEMSQSTLLMADILTQLLKEYRSECGFSYWVFPSIQQNNQKPFTPNTWTEKYWKPILRKYGLPIVGIHSLRHFFATFLISLNIPAPIVQRYMRHARISTTVDVYTHLSTRDMLNAVTLIDEKFGSFIHGRSMEG